MSIGFVLIHGYTGSTSDLAPLAGCLAERFGEQAVYGVSLPGHGRIAPPHFDENLFLHAIAAAARPMACRHDRIVLLGHSTGGTLALTAICRKMVQPALLVLIAAPHHADGAALARWERHRSGRPALALGEVARLVRHINQAGSLPPPRNMALLLVQGDADALVPAQDAAAWEQQGFEPVRRLTVPDGGHDLFHGPGGPAIADWIIRQTEDLLHPADHAVEAMAERLVDLEGIRLRNFFRVNPRARRRLIQAPAAQQALEAPALSLTAPAPDPIQLNIEVTTRCNLHCLHCGRTRQTRAAREMDPALFHYLLALLPNAYRIVLAGLGEPTLHPRLPELVAAAAAQGRLVSLVTNATLMTPDLFRKLAEAGLGAVTFSLDAADPGLAAAVRPGVGVDRILENIRACAALAASGGIATAVFTAVSARNAAHLPQLAEVVAALGVQAWMLTDLNFEWNQALGAAHDQAAPAAVRQALRAAFSRQLPVLGVHGLEAFALARRYRKFLLYPPERLVQRSSVRSHCFSPWQTLPVDVDANVTVCDCSSMVIGNLRQKPFDEIWNGAAMHAWRGQMLSAPPPGCRACPRF